MNNEKKEKNGDITITIPGTLLQSIRHVASRLENVQDLLSWLIHLLEGQGVDQYPCDDSETLPKSSGDCFDAPGVYLIYNNEVPGDCKDCLNYVESVEERVTCTGNSSGCDDCLNYVPMPDVCKICPTFVKRIWA